MSPRVHTQAPTVAEAVRQAAAICDPGEQNPGVGEFVGAFGEDGQPASAVPDLSAELHRAVLRIDPDERDPAVQMTAAAANWIGRSELGDVEPERVLRGGARLYFSHGVPPIVSGWLRRRGITV
jgi:hypothetical protein